MLLAVVDLQVAHHEIQLPDQCFDFFPGEIQVALNSRFDSILMTGIDNAFCKLSLAQGLASGERHATAACQIIRLILQDFMHHLIGSHLFPADCHCSGIADLCAPAALHAEIGIKHMDIVDTFVRLARAGIHAFIATDALCSIIMQIPFHTDSFGVMAPGTAHIASFQKNCRTDTRTVIQCKPLNLCDHAFHVSLLSSHTGFLLFLYQSVLSSV